MENPDELRGNISELAKEAGKCYLLEVDVSYPNDLLNLHNNLPLICEKRKISEVQKLVPNLYDKKKYIIHITALDQALEHGLVLDKVRGVIEFDLSRWLASYIKFNTKLRTRAKNNFEKNFFKLMNNSVFGKMMEDIWKHMDINLLTSEEVHIKRVMKPNFKSGMVFSENLMTCEMGKIRVVMNKPIYLGQAILDLSKIVMYYFHYDHIKLKHCANLRLCYMDTSSLVYDIKTDDFYEDIISNIKARFDRSGYSCSWVCPLLMGVNKKVIGLLKDELGGRIMTEFVALRPKLYTYKMLGGSGGQKVQGSQEVCCEEDA